MFFRPEQYDRMQRAELAKRFDANETASLERQLVQLRTKVFTEIYAPSVARSFVPKATDIAASVTTYEYQIFRAKGEVKLIAAKGNDLPRLDLESVSATGKVRPLGGSYGWDIFEMREAVRTGMPLSEQKARVAAEAIERGIDEMLALGSLPDTLGAYPDVGCTGLANNAAVIANPGGILSGSFWFGLTPPDPENVLAELNKLVITPASNSKNVFKANTVVLPTTIYNYVEQTVFSPLTGETILTVFQRNNKSISMVAPWWRLDGAGADGKHRGISFQRDPMTAESVIPQEMEIMPPEWQQLEMLHHCFARCGGVKIYQPLAFAYTDWAIS